MPAAILIKAVDATHANPAKSARGCYKRGDIVGVAPGGWEFGAAEGRPNFYVLRLTDVTRAQVVNWVENNWGTVIDALDMVDNNPFNYVRRRRVRFDLDLIPAGVLNTLNTTGEYSNTWANVRDFFRNKLTNATCAGVTI